MRYIFNLILLSLILFSSCNNKQDNIIIHKEFPNEEWQRFEYLKGDMAIIKAPVTYDLAIEVVVSDKYPNEYINHQKDGSFPLNITISNSDGIYRTKDYKFMLKDTEGYWNAEKKDGYYTFVLPVANEMTLTDNDTYRFQIENKYPKDPLCGIKSLKLKYIDAK